MNNWTLGEVSQSLTIIGVAWVVLSGAALWWLSKNFASRTTVQELMQRQERMDARLSAGDTRFAAMDAAIRETAKAADDAKGAADDAKDAAEKIGDVRVKLAELGGEIKTLNAILSRLERTSDKVVDGHLVMGAKS